VQRNVGAAPGIGRGRQVVGIGFSGDLEHGHGDFLRQFGTTGKPFRLGPGGHDLFSVGVAFVGFFLDAVLVVEHQQGLRQRFGGGGRAFGVIQQINQGLNIVTADHGAEQFSGSHAGNQRTWGLTLGDGGQKGGFDISGLIDPGGYAMGQQIQQETFLALGRVFQQFDQISGLLRSER
jgi:hypothetical protein